jgi:hypothetical protein
MHCNENQHTGTDLVLARCVRVGPNQYDGTVWCKTCHVEHSVSFETGLAFRIHTPPNRMHTSEVTGKDLASFTLRRNDKYRHPAAIIALLEEYWKAGCQCNENSIAQCDLCHRAGEALLTNGRLDWLDASAAFQPRTNKQTLTKR